MSKYVAAGDVVCVVRAGSVGSAIPGRKYSVSAVHIIMDSEGTRVLYRLFGMPDLIEAERCERAERV